MKPVTIIGGGWAGIACAVELAAAGRPVTLFEAAKQLGGRARSVEWKPNSGTEPPPLCIDNGQHLMVGAYDETMALLRHLGTAHLLERRRLDLRVPGFRLALPCLPAPLHLASGLLLATGLSLGEKWAAVRFIRDLQACRFHLPADRPAAELLRGQPQALIEKLWAPICIAALNTPIATASAQVFCNVLRDSLNKCRANSDLLFNRSDLSSLLADAALKQPGIDFRLGEKIAGLTRVAGGFHLSGPEVSVEAAVLAVHPARLPALLAGLPELADIAGQVAAFEWQPILTLWLRFADRVDFPFPMLGLGEGQAPWAFERSDIAPGVVALVVSADGPHLKLPAERLRDAYLALLEATHGPLPTLLNWKIITEKRATWACTPNLPRPGNATPLPDLYLTGDYTAGNDVTDCYPATLEGAVRSGVKCARLILSNQQ